MPRIALVTTRAARGLDDDLAPLEAAFAAAGATTAAVDWDDPQADWASFDLALVRSTWDYFERRDGFIAWAERAGRATRLLNPPDVLRWTTDKHYLAELAAAGVACVPGRFVEPGMSAGAAVASFLADPAMAAAEFVVKPAIGAGSRDAQRHRRDRQALASAHVARLLGEGRSVLLQPYLNTVDQQGETALIHFDGRFSHAIRKGALLRPGSGPTTALFAPEDIRAREPAPEELALARAALAALPFLEPPAYARVDLIRDDDGAPCLLELELAEPSLFFAYAPGSAERFVELLLGNL